ncbi:MAG: hypothetical protein DRI89_14205 [Bacteroidetes bacterium]|nr:MAG: hypothetical protein DRI89_14205 [Bacteroidota bacterium]
MSLIMFSVLNRSWQDLSFFGFFHVGLLCWQKPNRLKCVDGLFSGLVANGWAMSRRAFGAS